MVVLRESPWYQEILQEGELKGKQEGRQEGRQEEGRLLIVKQLIYKMGTLSPKLRSQIESLSLEKLEALGEALLDFSSANDLIAWLQSTRSA